MSFQNKKTLLKNRRKKIFFKNYRIKYMPNYIILLNNKKYTLSKELYNFLLENRNISFKNFPFEKEVFKFLIKNQILCSDKSEIFPSLEIESFFSIETMDFSRIKEKICKDSLGIFGIPYYKGSDLEYDTDSINYLKKISTIFPEYENSYFIGTETYEKKVYYFGDFYIKSKKYLVENFHKSIEKIIRNRIFPIFIGGDHSILYPIIKGMHKKYKKDLLILHLDAHTDRVDFDIKEEELTHGNVISLIENKYEIEVISYGIRGIVPKQIRKDEFNIKNLKAKLKKLKNKKLYLTCDFDVFDSNLISSVNYPVINGIFFKEYKEIIVYIKKLGIEIVGIDFVEFNALQGMKYISASNVLQIIFYTINEISNCKRRD